MDQDLHRQVRRRSEQGHRVSPCGPSVRRHSGSLTSYASQSWGHSAGSLSITPRTATNPANPPPKAAIFVHVHNPKFISTSLKTPVYHQNNRGTRLPSTRPAARSTKGSMTARSSPPGVPRPRNLWNASAVLHIPFSWMLSSPPLPSPLQTDFTRLGVLASIATSSSNP